jgi:predicted RNase H-like HicB family nuclease
MQLTLQEEQEANGRWLAEVLELPGVLAYGQTPEAARAHAQALALRVLAEQLEEGERDAQWTTITFAPAA